MSTDLSESERPWRLYIAVAIVVGLILAGLFFAGGQSPVVKEERPDEVDPETQRQRECEEQLAGIMAAVDPQQLGLSSRPSDRAFDLNLWYDDCGSLLVGEQLALDAALVQQLLPQDMAQRTLQAKYTSRDVAHLRTSVLLRQAAEHIIAGEESPLAQAVRIFSFVQRNVLERGADSPTMTPFEILRIGRGNARQRAWVTAELLRQVELDAVIVQPATAAAADADLWLLGVIVPAGETSSLHLFDPVVGVPIPAAGEQQARTPFVSQPATLAEVRANDALLRELDLPDNPYRFTAEKLQQVQIGLIGDSSVWSNRLAAIDYAIELRGATFYDGLGENRLKPDSLQARILTAGKTQSWTADDLFIWEFPEQELVAFGTPAAQGAQTLAEYQTVFDGPEMEPIKDFKTGEPLQWDHPLHKGRHLHITGAYSEAIKEYNAIRRGVGVFTTRVTNDLTLESAVYWSTACNYELGEFGSVINILLGGQYPPPFRTAVQPIWADGMFRLAAYGLAQQGAYPQAIEVLSKIPVTAPPHGVGYLTRRWTRLAKPNTPDEQPIAPSVQPEANSAEPAPGSAPDASSTAPKKPAEPAASSDPRPADPALSEPK